MTDIPTQPQKPFWQTVTRGMLCKCPSCGEGKLFRAYLKPVEACAHCNEPLGHIRADDGPAWLTIALVAHIVGPLLLAVVPGNDWPLWMLMLLMIVPTVALMLLILPRAKGIFIAGIWRLGCVGSQK